MAYLDVLKQAEAFHLLTDEALSKVEGFCGARQFHRGDRLFKEGEAALHLWVVMEGVVDLRFDLPGRETSLESTISSIHEHHIIGWSSLIMPHQYKLSAYCSSPECRALAIDREKFLAYLKENPKTGYQFFAAMLRLVGKRFERLQESAGEVASNPDGTDIQNPACGIMADDAGENALNAESLEQADVFKGMTDSQLSAIQRFADVIEFQKDERIFAQGDNASHVWIVREGAVRLQAEGGVNKGTDGKPLVSFMSQAQAFGWTCFVPPYRYRLSGYCDSPRCSVIRLDRIDLRRIFEEDFVIGFQVMSYLMAVVGTQFMQYQDAMARNRGIEMMNQW